MMDSAEAVRETVRQKYGEIARGKAECCEPTCCGPSSANEAGIVNLVGNAYEGIDGHFAAADLGLGCGLPTRHAGIRLGDTVLDLGAGAGNDAFIARRIVGDRGRLIGVDMTPEMVTRARANAATLGFANVEFRLGEIERLPVDEASIDVVVSNCVLNLVLDKARAFAETFRVLKPGARFCVSDVVSEGRLPPAARTDAELYVGCIAGAMEREEYVATIAAAGFEDVQVVEERVLDLPEETAQALADARLLSVTITGVRPA